MRDFLFANLEDEVFPKLGLLIKNEFAPTGANPLLYEMTPIYIEGNNDNDRVASLKVYPFTLRIMGRPFALSLAI